MSRSPRFNLRRFILDLVSPALAVWALHALFHAAEHIESSAPVSAWLLRSWLVLVVAVGFAALWRLGSLSSD